MFKNAQSNSPLERDIWPKISTVMLLRNLAFIYWKLFFNGTLKETFNFETICRHIFLFIFLSFNVLSVKFLISYIQVLTTNNSFAFVPGYFIICDSVWIISFWNYNIWLYVDMQKCSWSYICQLPSKLTLNLATLLNTHF